VEIVSPGGFCRSKKGGPLFVDAELSLTQLDVLDGKTDEARKRLEDILAK
jgi:hypothetical protein